MKINPSHRGYGGELIEVLTDANMARSRVAYVVYRDEAGRVWLRTRPDFRSRYQLIEPVPKVPSHKATKRRLQRRGIIP